MIARIMKDLEFADWAFENDVTDDMLCKAAREIEAGLIDARLGGFLIKKRVAAPGRSKSRSYRTIVGHRQAHRLVFIHGFAKNEQENITKTETKALQNSVPFICSRTTSSFPMVKNELILEIMCDEQNSEKRP